jgi:hypothetical protein
LSTISRLPGPGADLWGPHDVAEGADVAREHLGNAFGAQVAAAVDATTGLVTQPRDHRPGRALRGADLGRDITVECSSSGRCQCDMTPLRFALEVAACARF